MEHRRLGRTGLNLGVISLGTEYLIETPRETVVSVAREAVDRGVDYLDILFAYPHYRDNIGAALVGLRDRVRIAGHLGAAATGDQYRRTRDLRECEELFHDLLTRLKTDYVDILFLSNCDEEDDYRGIMASGGLLDLARRMQRQGKARFIGFSGHRVPVSLMAVESGEVDVLMHTINLQGDATEGRKELYRACAMRDIGLIAMKPFAGGALLAENAPARVTPIQCLSYVLSQPGVCSVVPGVKSLEELHETLGTLTASQQERDYSGVLPSFQKDFEGECVFCNHCLPCPAGIDIGKTMRLLAMTAGAPSASATAEYVQLPASASDCTECAACSERCPFGVDVIPKMRRAAEVFEKGPLSGKAVG